MKYVCFRHAVNRREELFLIPNIVTHAEFARQRSHLTQWEAVSAGFVSVYNGLIECYGKSVSLGLESREVDTFILNSQLSEE